MHVRDCKGSGHGGKPIMQYVHALRPLKGDNVVPYSVLVSLQQVSLVTSFRPSALISSCFTLFTLNIDILIKTLCDSFVMGMGMISVVGFCI